MSIWNHLETGLSVLQDEVIVQRKKAGALFQEKLPEVQSAIRDIQQSASDALSHSVPQIQGALAEAFESIKASTNEIIESLQTRNNTMEHKVLMMGGRRAGKSTILASILHLLKNAPGDLCTIADLTDYTQSIIGKDGHEYPLPTLDEKSREVVGYLRDMSEKSSFLVDLTPNHVNATYTLRVNTTYTQEGRTRQTNIELKFVDVPGEWMRKGVSGHEQLVNEVRQSDVIVIAIDTPYLMQDDVEVNEVYNRIPEISDTLEYLKVENEADWKQIIFCPVKCEKWAKDGSIAQVTAKVKDVYKGLINRWVQFPNVQIWIMPIQTVGSLSFDNHREAKLYFKDENDPTGTLCSEDEQTGIILDGTGKPVIKYDQERGLEFDGRWKIDGIKIPISWYRICGRDFSPQECEQPGYHILRFLVGKEENANCVKAESEKHQLEEMRKGPFGDILIWLKKFFNPTLGEYLPVWKSLITRLEGRHLIRESGEGFDNVKQAIL